MLFKHLFRATAYGFIMLLELFSVLAIAVGVLIGVLIFKPEAIINEKNLRIVGDSILPHFGVEFSFESFRPEFPRKNLYEREAKFVFHKLRVRTADLTILADGFYAGAGFDIHPDHFGLTMVGPTLVEEGVFALKLAPADPYEEKKPFKWDDKILARIREIKWQPVALHMKELNIEQAGKTIIKGPFDLTVSNQGRSWDVNFDTTKLEGTPILESAVQLVIKLPEDIEQTFPAFVKLDGTGSIENQGPVKLDGKMDIISLDDIRYKIAGSIGLNKAPIEAKLSGFFNQGRFASQIEGNADGLVDALPKISIKRCRLEGRYNLDGPEILNSRSNCDIDLERKAVVEETEFADLAPREFTIKIQAPLIISLKNNLTYLQARGAKAAVNPINNDVYRLSASVVGNFDGYLSSSTDTIESEIKADATLEIPEFQNLVKRLSKTDFAIPAPLHTLSGRIACTTQGKVVNFGQQVDVPLQCQTALKSTIQALAMDINGVVQTWLDKKPKLKLDVLFKDVAFELPKLRIEDPVPQFAPDARLQDKLDDKPKRIADQVLPIELDLSIKTAKPALLQTHLIQGEPVPIDVDIQVQGDTAKVKGQVSVSNYKVTLLKRNALVDHMIVKLDPAEESPALDGLFVFKETDFTINLLLKGSTDRPFYYLESDPPRSPTQLLSMLMYGGDDTGLDDDGLRSVEETRAAMVDGALGLMSMYYLASTPIDSVGYNPYTGVFRARVKIPGGLSLSVGSDLGGASQSVGLRKRLTENWSFETTAERDEETNESKGVALFKWGKRY